jgi:phenylalanyl-tRNA synthetase beta chain
MRVKLSAMGFNEIINYSFIAPTWKTWFEEMGLNLKNPISDEMSIMRTSLIPGIASVVAKNKRVQIKDIAVFEIGKCFIPKGEDKFPGEIERLGVAISGSRRGIHWSEPQAQVDFYDLKGMVEALILGAEFKPSSNPFLVQGMQADVFVGKTRVGYLGALHLDIAKNLDLSDEIFVSEILLDRLFVKEAKEPKHLPKFPSTWRDLSLVVDNHVTYEKIREAILANSIADLRQIEVVDLYRGEKLSEDKKGITLRITYQSFEKTLEDKVIDKWQEQIIHTLEKLDIHLR